MVAVRLTDLPLRVVVVGERVGHQRFETRVCRCAEVLEDFQRKPAKLKALQDVLHGMTPKRCAMSAGLMILSERREGFVFVSPGACMQKAAESTAVAPA